MGVGRAALRGGRQRFRERGQVEREKHDIRDGMSFRSWMRYTVSLKGFLMITVSSSKKNFLLGEITQCLQE